MKRIDTILVPIDFSDCAMGVVRQAAQLAKQVSAELVIMHAVEVPRGLEPGAQIAVGDHETEAVETQLERAALAQLTAYVEVAREEACEASARLVSGVPNEAIQHVSDEVDAGMIVMGTHGRTGIRRLLLGSVAEDVLRGASCPVLVIRSIHQPHCKPSSCQTCRSGLTPEMLQAEAEVDG